MEHWYVYYKVPVGARAATIAEVRRLQQSLERSSGTPGRLVANQNGESVTLMEIYEHIAAPERFEAALQQALSNSSLSAELRNARHTERFQDI